MLITSGARVSFELASAISRAFYGFGGSRAKTLSVGAAEIQLIRFILYIIIFPLLISFRKLSHLEPTPHTVVAGHRPTLALSPKIIRCRSTHNILSTM